MSEIKSYERLAKENLVYKRLIGRIKDFCDDWGEFTGTIYNPSDLRDIIQDEEDRL